MKALILLSDGFEETEALVPWDLLKRAGTEVSLVSVENKDFVTGTHGLKIASEIKIADYDGICDAIILPGGMPGAKTLSENPLVKKLVLKFNENNKIIAAICAAPCVLGAFGLLKNKNAICFPVYESKLSGAKISEKSVVSDFNVITAKAMGVSFEFGFEIIKKLYGEDKAGEIVKTTYFDNKR